MQDKKHVISRLQNIQKQFAKLKKRLEKNIQNGSILKYSRYKRKQLIRRYNRYAKQLKTAGLSAGLVAFLLGEP